MADIPKSEIEALLRQIHDQYELLNITDNAELDNQFPDIPATPVNEELTFCINGSILPFLGTGWGKPEPTRIWSTAKECDLLLNFSQIRNDLLIRFGGEYFKPNGLKGTAIELYLNGKIVASWDENHNSNLSTLILENQLSESGKVRLVFRFENPRSPESLNMSSDNRLLGFSFRTLFIKEIE